jgi:hypothetical protein
MSFTKISPQMALKLKRILYDYEEHADLNESSRDHVLNLQWYVRFAEYSHDLQHSEIAQYKNELLIALDYHQQKIQSFPKNTYTILRKSINALQFGISTWGLV